MNEAIKAKDQMLKAQIEAENEHNKTIILRSISHDLRTPLTAIKSASELLLAKETTQKQKDELSKVIEEKSSKIISIIENLLLLTKVESLDSDKIHKEEIPVEELLSEAIQNIQPIIEDRKVIVHPHDESLSVFGDFTLLSLVFSNILTNAIHFTSSKDGVIDIFIDKINKEIRFIISNNGEKILKEDINHIFELFYTKGRDGDSGVRSGGNGMGLAIVNAIIRLHQGSVKAYNTNDGVAFEFNILVKEDKSNGKNINN